MDNFSNQVIYDISVEDSSAYRTSAAYLLEALLLLKSINTTNDFFTGYSLAEIIQERINVIGVPEDDLKNNVFIDTEGTKTVISKLNYIKDMLVGADEKSGVIQLLLDTLD